jgi:peptidoglycan/LPS O-acetylase OafA/YrhL
MFAVYVSPVARAPEFVAGMLSARICGQLPLWAHAWDGWGWVFDGLLIATTAVWRTLRGGDSLGYDHMTVQEHFLPVLVSLLNIAAFASPRTQGVPTSGLLGRCLSCAPLQKLAVYSYAVYILQGPTFNTLNKLVPPSTNSHHDPFGLRLLILPVVVAHVIGVAAVHLVQEPAESLSHAFFKRIS